MSPVATITPSDAEDRILTAADDLFYTNGVAAVTMSDLRDRAGVSMRRLYAVFPTKSDVVTGWLKHRHGTWMRAITTDVQQRTASGADPLDAVFGAIEQWMVSTDFRGCGFVNTHAEASRYTPTHQRIIGDHKAAFAKYLTTIVPTIPALAILIDGAMIHASIFRSVEPIRSAHALAQRNPQ